MTELPSSAAGGAAPADAPVGTDPAAAPQPAVAPVPEPTMCAEAVPVAAVVDPLLGTEPPAEPVVEAAEPAQPAAEAPEAPAQGPDSPPETAPESGATQPPAPPELPVAAAVGVTVDGPAPRRRRSLALRFAFAFLFGVVLVVGIGAGALYAWGQQYDGRVLPGVHVGDTDLSGLTRSEAQAAIASSYAALGTGSIVLNGPSGPVSIAYADIARGPDTAAILDAALAAGRQGAPLADLIGAPQAALHGVTVGSAVTYDRAKLAAAVDALAAKTNRPAVDATVSDQNGTYVVTSAVEGASVDTAAILAALDAQLGRLNTPAQITVDMPVTPVAPAVPTSAADAAKAAADRMAADLVLVRGTASWTIPSAALQPMISFTPAANGAMAPAFDPSGLDAVLKTLATKVNQKAQDAGLKLVNGHVVAVGTSQEGRTLDAAATKAAIVAQMAARQAGTAIEPLAPVIAAVTPKLSKAQANDFAARMRPISTFSIYYWVIVNNHFGGNIEGPANKINGTVVPAGTTFDFWKVVGDLHNVAGVGPGNAIEGGKITVTGAFGGGICTTSTTLFNAAIHAGMVPLARQNHNEYITRYPAGLDATVWIVGNAKQTMSFKNDTAYPILIQRIITYAGSKRWLTFKIWSVPNGRKTIISNTVIQNGPRATARTVEDPTKPVGYRFFNNAPADGAKVWVTVTIYDHGKLHWTKRYYSNYPAVDGVIVVGTKGTPKPKPTPTPSPAP